MTKTHYLTALLLLIALAAGPVSAEIHLDTRLTMADVENDRKTMVMATVAPSPQQSKEFWEIYDAYREEMGELNTRNAKVVEEYVASYAALNDDQAEDMLKELTKVEIKKVKTRQKYAKKLGKVLIPKQLLRWLQTENKMDATIALAAAALIPLDR